VKNRPTGDRLESTTAMSAANGLSMDKILLLFPWLSVFISGQKLFFIFFHRIPDSTIIGRHSRLSAWVHEQAGNKRIIAPERRGYSVSLAN